MSLNYFLGCYKLILAGEFTVLHIKEPTQVLQRSTYFQGQLVSRENRHISVTSSKRTTLNNFILIYYYARKLELFQIHKPSTHFDHI